ncbi:MAG: spermidine/putrescine ABC transporter substrate-binding protein [Proteobacteria bacterium]|nr:MAG: spermidine/putrescine ABC transporter substrate-binding protein [Pseudomonadota bacterium]
MAIPIAKNFSLAFSLVAALALFSFPACTKREAAKELRLFTWSEYFTPEELRAFEKETGIKTKADYYSSNEEMLTKIQLTADGDGYDLVLPSDYMVRTMIDLKLLAKLDHGKLPFLKDFPSDALHPPYDKELSYSVPLAVGYTGLAWNSKLLPELPNAASFSWRDFFELATLSGRVTVLDDTKETLQAVLLTRGKDLATASAEDIRNAFAYLTAHKGQLKGFTSETRSVIEADECALCMAYSGDVLAVAAEKPEIKFVRPKEGITVWTDNFAIPKNARNPEGAYRFMAKVLSAKGASSFTSRTRYRTFQEGARPLLPDELAKNPVVYPEAAPGEFHFLVQRNELADLIDRSWALLKSH